ncbi:MAG TPA: hypothetical protein EYO17_02570 [Dehalococcoidia bacterium]|nr:hypothetical protein [Dehalococcoidia bacterium]
MPIEAYNDNVFLNCPFDPEYRQIFNAIVFTIYDCGFVARCSLEEDASGDARFAKILDIIAECRYSINDISRTELDKSTAVPRFNMPCELGVFIGASMCGASIPPDLDRQLDKCADDDQSARALGIEHATKQVEELWANGVPGIHFYVLNRSYSVSKILDNLDLPGHSGRD